MAPDDPTRGQQTRGQPARGQEEVPPPLPENPPPLPPEAAAPAKKPRRKPAQKNQQLYIAVFDDKLRRVPIGEGTLLIGRSRDVHLRVHDHLLSRKHCSLTRSGEELILTDLNSSNGTYVNGEKISTRSVVPDDIVEFGKTVLVIFDGEGWNRGEGMMNLRNPVKAQELVGRLREGGEGLEVLGEPLRTPDPGVRSRKGLSDEERAFLGWLEKAERRLLPDLVGEYLTHKLISLLVRRSPRVRGAFTSVLEAMMHPEFFSQFEDVDTMRAAIRELVHQELENLPKPNDLPEEPVDRGLLEPDDPIGTEEGDEDGSR